MADTLKPYPQYKESHLEWLGRIPSHWRLERTKQLFRLRTTKAPIGHGLELLSIYTHIGVRPRKELEQKGNKATSTDGYWIVNAGDIIVNKLLAWMGAIGVSHYDGVTSPAYDILKPIRLLEPDFYHHVFRTGTYLQQFRARSRGIMEMRLRLYFDQLGQIPVPFPPLDEQQAIVRFLNWESSRLERVIRAKRRLIKVLEEQKRGIVHLAITRGLDPTVARKPSGISWIGDIPQHWRVEKLKYLTRFVNGFPFKPSDWKDEGIPIIRIQNLNGSDIFNYTSRADLPDALLIQPGDLMFAWSGNKGTSFGSFEWKGDVAGYLNQHIFKLTGYTLPRRYFYYILRAVTRHVEEQAGGIIGLVHVTKPELGSVQVPVAPPEEADVITKTIDAATANIDRVISRLEAEIRLVREYERSSVAEIVTGKLDVREFQLSGLTADSEDDLGKIEEAEEDESSDLLAEITHADN